MRVMNPGHVFLHTSHLMVSIGACLSCRSLAQSKRHHSQRRPQRAWGGWNRATRTAHLGLRACTVRVRRVCRVCTRVYVHTRANVWLLYIICIPLSVQNPLQPEAKRVLLYCAYTHNPVNPCEMCVCSCPTSVTLNQPQHQVSVRCVSHRAGHKRPDIHRSPATVHLPGPRPFFPSLFRARQKSGSDRGQRFTVFSRWPKPTSPPPHIKILKILNTSINAVHLTILYCIKIKQAKRLLVHIHVKKVTKWIRGRGPSRYAFPSNHLWQTTNSEGPACGFV